MKDVILWIATIALVILFLSEVPDRGFHKTYAFVLLPVIYGIYRVIKKIHSSKRS